MQKLRKSSLWGQGHVIGEQRDMKKSPLLEMANSGQLDGAPGELNP